MWGEIPSEPFDWNRFFGGLLSQGLRPGDIAELTFDEALLYTLAGEKPSISPEQATSKLRALKALPIEDKIALAVLRSGG